ncbi:MAG TPA: hypothetical protein VIH99_01915 [Bdellovibrionota bacterium]|jgi:hypothetical protein
METGRNEHLGGHLTDRWFLRVQGHTLGPFARADVSRGLKMGDFALTDRVCSSQDSAWSTLSEHPAFAAESAALTRPLSQQLQSPPSPLLLRRRPLPPLPVVVPVAPPIPVEEVAVETKQEEAPVLAKEIALPETPEIFEERITLPPIEMAPVLEKVKEEEKEKAEVREEASLPTRPDFRPVIADPVNWGALEEETPVSKKKKKTVLKVEFNLPERTPGKVILLLLVLGIAGAAGYWLSENKTRDLKDSRLPDPSSPTTTPLEAGDPIPPLKAPTRPQRD